jgi:UDP-N-acetylglucosamine/UDP-N-acetylgalactosamine diphosphorylase
MLTKVEQLAARQVRIHAPGTVFVDDHVNLDWIESEVELFPGARIEGAGTRIGAGSRIGLDGQVTVRNTAIGRGVTLASGTFDSCVFLDGSSHGPSGQGRGGTLFEEGASAAHAVGTKQTILFPWATLGSNINFCDTLLTGGRSRRDHSEVGSGFIHFNYTPYGPSGDKATPSCFGGTVDGVWLRERRIFLGGAGGIVGPVRVGFGTVLAAGSVYRQDRQEGVLVYAEPLVPKERQFDQRLIRRAPERIRKNIEFMAELHVLRVFYEAIRRRVIASDAFQVGLIDAAALSLRESMTERCTQLGRLIDGLGESLPELRRLESRGASEEALQIVAIQKVWPTAKANLSGKNLIQSAMERTPPELIAHAGAAAAKRIGHTAFVQGLPDSEVKLGKAWLGEVQRDYLEQAEGASLLLAAAM